MIQIGGKMLDDEKMIPESGVSQTQVGIMTEVDLMTVLPFRLRLPGGGWSFCPATGQGPPGETPGGGGCTAML